MSFEKVLSVLALLLLVSSYTQKKQQLILTVDDLPDVITQFPLLFIYFYSSECQVCKQFTPIFNDIARQFNASGSQLRFANINAKDYPTVRAAYDIRHYPTLMLFVRGQRLRYRGERSKEGVNKWLESKLGEPVRSISAEQVQELKGNGEVSIIFYGEIETHQHGTLFRKAALADDYNTYYTVEGTDLSPGTVQILRPFAQPVTTSIDKQLSAWIAEHDRPPVVSFDARTINSLFFDKNLTVILFEPAQQSENLRDAFKDAARKVKEQLRKQFIFTIIEHQSPYHKSLSGNINITAENSPIVLLDGTKGAKFVLSSNPTEITAETIVAFIANFEAGKLKKYDIKEQVIYPKKAKGDDEL